MGTSNWNRLYRPLSHALKNTANQKPGLPLHILRFATDSIPLYFPVITCAQQFTGVHLRTSQRPALKLFNSFKPLRTFQITSGNSKDFPKILKTHKNIWKLLWTLSEVFRKFLKISEHMRRFSDFKKSYKHLDPVVESPISANPGLTLYVLLRVNPRLVLIGLWTTGPWKKLLNCFRSIPKVS